MVRRRKVGTSEAPRQIGAFRIERVLGRGGLGEVFLAWDLRLRRSVALKRLHASGDRASTSRRRLLEEARAAAGIVHPAVVQVFDIVESEHGDFLVMEHVVGETIAQFLRRGPIDRGLAMRLAREIAEGLAAGHDKGFVHLDLKAENVMVTADGHAKILDYGLATVWRPDVAEPGGGGVRAGTPRVMAPEQVRGHAVRPSTDLWALGVLIHEMRTGRPPFVGASNEETFAKILDEPYPGLDDEDDVGVEALLRRLLAKTPADRPKDAPWVAAALDALGTSSRPASSSFHRVSSDVEDAATGSFGPAKMPSRRRAAILGLVLVMATMGFWAWQRQDAGPGIRRVVVLEPEVDGEDAMLAVLGSAVLTASLETMASTPALVSIDPRQIPAEATTPVQVATATGADDVWSSRVMPWPGVGSRIVLERLDGTDGSVVWTAGFEAPLGARGPRLLADAVAGHLSRAFPGQGVAPAEPRGEVRDGDYAAFLDVWRGFRDDGLATVERQETIDRVLDGSPRFFAAVLLAADLALSRFASDRQPSSLTDAERAIEFAARIAPEDPRPAYRRVRAALETGRYERAEAALADLERLAPGDPELLSSRATLSLRRGDVDEARIALRELVARNPVWQNLYRLGALELRGGWVDDARQHLEAVLELVPESALGRIKLAELELIHGDLGRAASLYEAQLAVAPRRSLHTNLGLVRYLQRRYEDAIASYHQALALAPGNPTIHLNLADAEWALGRHEKADGRYREVVDLLEVLGASAALQPDEEMSKAQALAHLGRGEVAREIVRRVTSTHPRDGEVALQAAVVHAVLRDADAATAAVARAVTLGVATRWFEIPVFDGLRDQPAFRNATESRPAGD